MSFTLMREERSRPGYDACVRRLPVEDPGETAVWRCRDCGQHFWKGSHWADMAGTLAEL
jgi:uncharacterized protein with PIN domain